MLSMKREDSVPPLEPSAATKSVTEFPSAAARGVTAPPPSALMTQQAAMYASDLTRMQEQQQMAQQHQQHQQQQLQHQQQQQHMMQYQQQQIAQPSYYFQQQPQQPQPGSYSSYSVQPQQSFMQAAPMYGVQGQQPAYSVQQMQPGFQQQTVVYIPHPMQQQQTQTQQMSMQPSFMAPPQPGMQYVQVPMQYVAYTPAPDPYLQSSVGHMTTVYSPLPPSSSHQLPLLSSSGGAAVVTARPMSLSMSMPSIHARQPQQPQIARAPFWTNQGQQQQQSISPTSASLLLKKRASTYLELPSSGPPLAAADSLNSLLAAVDKKTQSTKREPTRRYRDEDSQAESPRRRSESTHRAHAAPQPHARSHRKRARNVAADSASEGVSDAEQSVSGSDADDVSDDALPTSKPPRSSAPLKRNHLVCGTIRSRPGAKSLRFRTVIQCGMPDKKGVTQLNFHSEFFGGSIDCYTAEVDPLQRPLVRASTLADKFHCATNKIGMYLARRRTVMDGIYQATEFSQKPTGKTGLKCGGYFLTEDACREFQRHYNEFATKKDPDDAARRRRIPTATSPSASYAAPTTDAHREESAAQSQRRSGRKVESRSKRPRHSHADGDFDGDEDGRPTYAESSEGEDGMDDDESDFEDSSAKPSRHHAAAAAVAAPAPAPAVPTRRASPLPSTPAPTPAPAPVAAAATKSAGIKTFATPSLVAVTGQAAAAMEDAAAPAPAAPNFLERIRNSEKQIATLAAPSDSTMTEAEMLNYSRWSSETKQPESSTQAAAPSTAAAAAAASSTSTAGPHPSSPSTSAVSSALDLIRQSLSEADAKKKFVLAPMHSSFLAGPAPVPFRVPVFSFLRGGSMNTTAVVTPAAAASGPLSADAAAAPRKTLPESSTATPQARATLQSMQSL